MRLLLMRHAKSDRANWRGEDRTRPLSARGRRAARLMGRLLTALDEAPDVVLTSPALRALSTATLATEAGDWPPPRVVDRLYGAGPAESLEIALDHADGRGSILVVGHEPTCSLLVRELTGAAVSMKTATVAAIDLAAGPPGPERGSLVYLLQPRLFAALAPVLP